MRNALALEEGESSGRLLYEAALRAGRQALGRPIGALAPGLRADIVVLNVGLPEMAAVQGDRWLDQYEFVHGARAVDRVYAGGRLLVAGGRHVRRAAIETRFARTFARLAAG